MKTFKQLLSEMTKAELASHYDNLEKKQGPLDKKTDLEADYGKGVRDHMSPETVYGKKHRPGIDFVHDPAHEHHPLHATAEKLGYKYSGSSHLVGGKPFHIYTHKLKDMGVKNMATTHSKTDSPRWSFNQYEGGKAEDLHKAVTGHVAYQRKKQGLKKVPGITS